MDLNKVMIIGRLTRDPELRTTPNGAQVCQLGLATNYVYTNQQSGQKVEQVEYHNVVLWRKLAEIAAQYLKKGRRVYIEGRLQTRSWDGKDGVKRSKTEIVCDNMIMLDGGSGGGGNAGPSSGPMMASAPSDRSQVVDEQSSPEEELPTIDQGNDLNVEDIPF
jgi:single-strand DNA-binding protein